MGAQAYGKLGNDSPKVLLSEARCLQASLQAGDPTSTCSLPSSSGLVRKTTCLDTCLNQPGLEVWEGPPGAVLHLLRDLGRILAIFVVSYTGHQVP
jgi:hypothetical protein